MTKKDRWLLVGLLALTVAVSWPLRSEFVFHWDSAEFCLALDEYDVAKGTPHPPGFFVYLMAARLLNFVVGDAHQSLLALSLVGGVGVVWALFELGARMFDRRVGWIAAALAVSSPQLWFHRAVALMYIVDALAVCVTVWCCWRALRRGVRWSDAVWIGVCLAVVGGIRQQTAPGLLPVALFTFWQGPTGQRLGKCAVAGAVAVAGGLLWFVPMVQLSGGFAVWWEVVERFTELNAPKTFARGGLDALYWNLFFTTMFCWNGLGLGLAALVAGLLSGPLRLGRWGWRSWAPAHRLPLTLLGLWIAPLLALGTLVAYTEMPGHVLSFLPGLILLAAVCLG